MHVLWMSDGPQVPSGFGNVTRHVCSALAARGHRVDIVSWQHKGEPTDFQGCTVHPGGQLALGADALPGYLRRLRPDVLITLADIWWLTWMTDPENRRFLRIAGIPWMLYFPVDGDCGDLRLPNSWVELLRLVDIPVAMSRYGQAVADANGIIAEYIPHGVDVDIFTTPTDRTAPKAALGYEGRFVVLSDARNQPRKMIPRTLDIFRRFAATVPDALLHLHCDPDDPAARSEGYAYDLRADLDLLGAAQPDLREQVRLTPGMSIDRGLPLAELATLYAAADVHLLSSWGEGFGLPTLQSCAAGVIPVTIDYTASKELAQDHGAVVPAAHWLLDDFRIRRGLLDVGKAAMTLRELHDDPDQLRRRRVAVRDFAKGYAWSAVVDRWEEVLNRRVPRARELAAVDEVTVVRWDTRRLATYPSRTLEAVASRTEDIVLGALRQLPSDVRVSVSVAQAVAGRLTAQVMRDATGAPGLTVPVTLEPPPGQGVRRRVPGRVLAASAADVPLVRRLARVFPWLSVWSPVDLDLGLSEITGRHVTVTAAAPDAEVVKRLLATTTLAVDVAGSDPDLPLRAARAAVPCLSRAASGRELFPGLVEAADLAGTGEPLRTDEAIVRAALACRAVLVDQGLAADVCLQARDRLDGDGHAVAASPLPVGGQVP